MKIAIFHCGFVYSGGGERIVLEEARGLKKRSYHVSVFAPTVDEKLCYPKLLNQLNVQMFLPSFIKWLPLRDALRMVASSVLAPILSFKFKDIDLFIGANQPGAWIAFCMAKVLKKPYVVYLNQPNRLIYPRKIDQQTGWQNRKDYYLLAGIIKAIKPFVRWADKVSVTSAKVILVNGNFIGRIIEKIYQHNVIFCPAGAYIQAKNKLFLEKKDIFEGSFNIKDNKIKKPYLLITNRHEPQKKFEYVIEAFPAVLKKMPNVSLIIPGPFTSWTPKLVALTQKLKISSKVCFLGQIPEADLQKLYQSAAVYCYPSPEEDFGLGPLEAGAWGVPTVAWNHSGPTMTVRHLKTGYLAKPYDLKDYSQGILLLLDKNRREKMGLSSWRFVKNNFSWEKHLSILEKAIKNNLLSRVQPLTRFSGLRPE